MSGGHSMESTASVQEARQSIREEVRKLCQNFPDRYWQDVDKHEKYPQEFVDALTESGYLAALIPEEYGGAGLGITEASIILEEINRSGGNSAVCHAQMYTMGTLLRHGSEDQKRRYLPAIAQGKLRLQAFAVTEPNAGSETTRIETRAVRKGDHYIELADLARAMPDLKDKFSRHVAEYGTGRIAVKIVTRTGVERAARHRC